MAVAVNSLTGLPFDSLVPTADFAGKVLGDTVYCYDGSYSVSGQVFVVEGGKLRHIWNDVDGQMELPFEGI